VLGNIKIPSGIDEIRTPRVGIRLRCLGRAKTNREIANTAKIEFKNLIATVEAAMSSLAKELMVQ
jgi:hypothetical protein